tara:strand:+ start:155 stop:262 length:108 start_codon:yes stop_codon:yes gene_type:complete
MFLISGGYLSSSFGVYFIFSPAKFNGFKYLGRIAN